MAEAQQVPSFKLVLVGDGGTGKVRRSCALLILYAESLPELRRCSNRRLLRLFSLSELS